MRYDKQRQRVYIAGFRIHHGAVSVAVALIALIGAWHDRSDWRDWFTGR